MGLRLELIDTAIYLKDLNQSSINDYFFVWRNHKSILIIKIHKETDHNVCFLEFKKKTNEVTTYKKAWQQLENIMKTKKTWI